MTTDPSPWLLDPEVTFLNHGSFGSCPRPVMEDQQRWRQRLEREPVRFMAQDLEGLMDKARTRVATFVGADPRNLAFVANTTTGVNAVLRSLPFAPGDELLLTNHEYNACANAIRYVAETSGAQVKVIDVAFPCSGPDQVCEQVLAAVTPHTRLVLLDHITSATGMILPLARLVAELDQRGIDTLVDGAHAPGMVPLDLNRLGAAYYTGNLHKWVCAPKSAGFLHVRPDRQDAIRPLVISHGANSQRSDRSRFQLEFDWMGTIDPSAYLSVPRALDFMASLSPDGWPGVMAGNRQLALEARDILCTALDCTPPVPDEMLGSLVSLRLPDGNEPASPSPLYQDPLQEKILAAANIHVPVMPWPAPPRRLLRISAQVYNRPEDYRRLAEVLTPLLAAEQEN
jgi:isopenicillin-N epimerase